MPLEKTLQSPFDGQETKPVNSKGKQSWILAGKTDAEAEAPILFTRCEELTNWKSLSDVQKDWKQEAKGTTEYEVGWHHHFVGHEFEQAPGVGEVLWSLACYGPVCRNESDMTEWLYSTEDILECTKLRHWYLLTDVINCCYHLPYSCH